MPANRNKRVKNTGVNSIKNQALGLVKKVSLFGYKKLVLQKIGNLVGTMMKCKSVSN